MQRRHAQQRHREERSGACGFTLIELTLASAIVLLLATFILPIGMRFLSAEAFDDQVATFVSSLRLAQIHASSGYDDRAFGVRLLPDQYVIFEGATYESRLPEEDEHVFTDDLTWAGPEETVFARGTGIPSAPATYTCSSASGDSAVVRVHHHGLIEQE